MSFSPVAYLLHASRWPSISDSIFMIIKKLFLGQGLLYLMDLWFGSLFEGVEPRGQNYKMTSPRDNVA